MLLSAVSVLVVAQSSSEIPEGLMNNPVYLLLKYISLGARKLIDCACKIVPRGTRHAFLLRENVVEITPVF